MSTENEGADGTPAADASVTPPSADRPGAGAAAPRTPDDTGSEGRGLPAQDQENPAEETTRLQKAEPDAAGFPPPPAQPPAQEAPQPAPSYDPWAPPPGDGAAPLPAAGGFGAYGGGPAPDHVPAPAWGAPPAAPGRRFGSLVAAVIAAALLAGGVGGGVGFWAAEHSSSSSTTISAGDGSQTAHRPPDSVAGIASRALPSVVTIEAAGGGESGTGTGFVYDKQGHILTNNHVVAGAANGGRLTATFSNGKKYQAEVVGSARGYDVAVLRLENASDAELTPLPLGDSDKAQVGDATIAIGAPYGLSGTVTTGIISAKDRPVSSSDGQGSAQSYMSALQTDASINPGNSGGPLLNADGAVIGVNSAIQSATGGFGQSTPGSIGLGFAIPINQAQRVAKTLIETGEPVYPVIGVQVDLRERGNGARIVERTEDGSSPVTPGGPADRAGLEPGDLITEFDGTAVDSGPTLISEIWTHRPGEKVEITYERDGRESTVELVLGSRRGD